MTMTNIYEQVRTRLRREENEKNDAAEQARRADRAKRMAVFNQAAAERSHLEQVCISVGTKVSKLEHAESQTVGFCKNTLNSIKALAVEVGSTEALVRVGLEQPTADLEAKKHTMEALASDLARHHQKLKAIQEELTAAMTERDKAIVARDAHQMPPFPLG